jgi:membrane protease YdiL (CAAX protease family)
MGTESYKLGEYDERVRSLTHSLGLIVGSFAVGVGLVLFLFSLASAFYPSLGSLESLSPPVQALSGALQYVGFLLVGVGYLYWRDDDGQLFDIGMPSLRDVGWIVAGLVALLIALNILTAVISQLGLESAANNAITQGQSQPTYLLYLIPVTILFTAPAEELIYRGLVQGLFRRAYGVVPGVVIASLLFGTSHYLALGGQGSKFVYLAIAAVLGLILGALYEYTQNLTVPIAVHGIYNAVQFYVAYLAATGQIQLPG